MSSAWVELQLSQIDEDGVYASIGAYDPEAFAAYKELERQKLEKIEQCHDTLEDRMFRDRELARASFEALKLSKENDNPEFVAFERKGWQMSGESNDNSYNPDLTHGELMEEIRNHIMIGEGWEDPMEDPEIVASYERDGMVREGN